STAPAVNSTPIRKGSTSPFGRDLTIWTLGSHGLHSGRGIHAQPEWFALGPRGSRAACAI
ncbi:hypothetical protein, partial [Corynebacterium striatum]|uniref:hypothetical protein n=1 Tax=Corynebacterium striatum TaxID=43770 RepID=UPI001C0EE38E